MPNGKHFWAGKGVCVTGGCGLVGSALVPLLVKRGAAVLVLDDMSRGRNRIAGAQYLQDDAADALACRAAFIDVDVVINLAAYVAGVTFNQDHNTEMYLNNARLQITPARVADEMEIQHFLQVSSVCVYAEDKQDPCIESEVGGDPNRANAGYAWAKRMGENAVGWSNIEHAVIVRPANIYGINDYFDERAHVIPALIAKTLGDGDTIEVNGTGNEVREFLYADDAARGMLTAIERGASGEVYNIGTNGANSCTISELAYMIRDILGVDKAITFTGGNSGDKRRIVNGDKLARLGWQAEVGLAEGLKRVCEWHQER